MAGAAKLIPIKATTVNNTITMRLSFIMHHFFCRAIPNGPLLVLVRRYPQTGAKHIGN
jgi:hypothetical protein